MSFKCPHCGSALEVLKCVDITKAKAVAQPEGDLASGIIKATVDAFEEKVEEVTGTQSAISSLDKLNQLANGSLGEQSSGLAAGWGGAMYGALQANRDEQEHRRSYDPEEMAKADPDNLDKAAVAKTLQNMIHGALGKGAE